jgi:hypothetical protein
MTTMGRPSKLEDATAEKIIDALKVGSPIRVACRAAGIGQTTFKAWMTRGNSEADDDAPYRAFRADVKKARAAGEAAALKVIHEAMPTSWQAAAWFLERHWPERWGRRDRIKAKIENDRPGEKGEFPSERFLKDLQFQYGPIARDPDGQAKIDNMIEDARAGRG